MRFTVRLALVSVVLMAVGLVATASEAKAGWGVSLGAAPAYGAYYGAPYGGYYSAPYSGYYAAPTVVAPPVASPYYVAPAPVYRYVTPPPVPVSPFGIGLNFYGGSPGYGYGYHHHHGHRW